MLKNPSRRGGTVVRLFAAAFALTLVFAPAAQAQQQFDDKPQVWWDKLEAQLTHSLDSDLAVVREQTLQHIIFFGTHYPEHFDFTNAAVKVLALYERPDDDTHRILALMAMHAIANEHTMDRLREVVDWERSERVRQLARAVLADYYTVASL